MRLRSFLLVIVSAIAFPLALPNEFFPFGNFFIGLICLIPYYFALTKTRTIGSASLAGIIFGAISTILANYWLMFYGEFSLWTLGGVTVGYIGYNALFAPYLWYFLRSPDRYRPFLFAASWAAYEYLKSVGYLGYPWGLSAYPAGDILPLIQFVDITGVWGLSFLMVLVNALFAEFIMYSTNSHVCPAAIKKRYGNIKLRITRLYKRGERRNTLIRQTSIMLILFISVISYGFIRLGDEIPVRKKVDVVLVQQNSDSWIRGNELETIKTAQDLSRKGIEELPEKPDMIVWSETTLPWDYRMHKDYYKQKPENDPLIDFIKEINTYLVTGATVVIDPKSGDAMNGVILLSPEGTIIDYYGKQHPVPFAEHIPFWEFEPVQRFFREAVGLYSTWTIGDKYTLFSVPVNGRKEVIFGTPICFEDAFAYLCRNFVLKGAEILVNLTNNSWSKTNSAQVQHFVAARFRAVENKRLLLRSTNSGFTSVVDPWARIIHHIPMFTEEYLSVEIPVYRENRFTVYTLLGDYFPLLLFSILAIYLILSLRKPPEGTIEALSKLDNF